jgi:hypothetical protein
MSYRVLRRLGASALVAGCASDGGPAPAAPVLTVQPQEVSLAVGSSAVVGASVAGAPAGAAIPFRWRVRDSAVVVIDSLSRGGGVAHLRRIAPGGTLVTVVVPALGLSADVRVTLPLL